MKTQFKLLAALMVLASIALSSLKISAQAYAYGSPVATTPPHDELQSQNAIFDIVQGTGTGAGTQSLIGFGINKAVPAYMLDIYCDPSLATPTYMDVNISSNAASPIPANAAGYRIGGKQMLFTQGDNQSIFVGGGQIAPAAAYAPATFGDNVFVGFKTYNNLINGAFNTVVGCQAATNFVDGAKDTP